MKNWLLAPGVRPYTAQETSDAQANLKPLNEVLKTIGKLPAVPLHDAPNREMVIGRSIAKILGFENLYGGNHAALTESEARALIRAGSLDTAGERIFAAGQSSLSKAQPGVFSEARPPSRAQVLEARGTNQLSLQ